MRGHGAGQRAPLRAPGSSPPVPLLWGGLGPWRSLACRRLPCLPASRSRLPSVCPNPPLLRRATHVQCGLIQRQHISEAPSPNEVMFTGFGGTPFNPVQSPLWGFGERKRKHLGRRCLRRTEVPVPLWNHDPLLTRVPPARPVSVSVSVSFSRLPSAAARLLPGCCEGARAVCVSPGYTVGAQGGRPPERHAHFGACLPGFESHPAPDGMRP